MSENAKIAAAQRLEEEKNQRDAPPELRNIFGVPLEDESSEDIVANPRRKLGRPASPAMSCTTSHLAAAVHRMCGRPFAFAQQT